MTDHPPGKKTYDLEERTTRFSEAIITFLQKLPETVVTRPLISQLIRSATSISANYCEANDASSKKDFINKIAICKKESRETMHWLRLIAHALPNTKEQARIFWKEAHELNLIFATIILNSRKKLC